MSVHRADRGGRRRWQVRWREGTRNRQRTFDLKRDADAFDAEVRRRLQLAGVVGLDDAHRTVGELAEEWFTVHARPNLQPSTCAVYASLFDNHVEPRLGSVPLREVNVRRCQRFAAELEQAGVGPAARRKTLALLGTILQAGVEWSWLQGNPMRAVRRPSARRARDIPGLAPSTVETMRAAVEQRDAVLISVLAYAGLRPQEALALRWRDIGERKIAVYAPKTGQKRSVTLLAPLAADLKEWRLASGRPPADALLFPAADGRVWDANAYKSWARKAPRGRKGKDGKRRGSPGPFARAAASAGVPDVTPYALRHAFCSLLLHEGRSVVYVANQLGHGPQLTLTTYGHLIDELEDAPRIPAEDAIRAARGEVRSPVVRAAGELE